MVSGYATPEGTARYVARVPELAAAGFYRVAGGLHVSSLGLGTYLGEINEKTDAAYAEAIITALASGINFLDTAINYRHQSSERAMGRALSSFFRSAEFQRDEVVVSTKAGFLTPGAIDPSTLRREEIVGGMHSMAPDFLADQIDRSRTNLDLDTLDVFYLHNPETQLDQVSSDEFDRRIRAAFARLEMIAAEGKIRCYGTATWNGYRRPAGARDALSLARLVALAAEVAGSVHHFRYIQLPFNLAMTEAFTEKHAPGSTVLEVAGQAGITVVASASLLQAKLSRNLPEAVVRKLPGLATDAQRAIQFARSTPGITVALVGMSRVAHVRENLAVARTPPLTGEAYLGLYSQQ